MLALPWRLVAAKPVALDRSNAVRSPSRRSRSYALRSLAAVGWLAVATLSTRDAGAVGTRAFSLDSLESLSGGDLKGVSVGSDGQVRAGLTLGSAPLGADAQGTFSALALRDGSVLVGTSPRGKILRVVGDTAEPYADTEALAVTALAELRDGSVIAATIPDGKLFKVTRGKVTPFATLPGASYAWALAVDTAGTAVYVAAGGPEGKVFRVSAGGQVETLFKSTERHIVSVAVGKNGEIFAGSSGKGLIYSIKGPGRAEVLYEPGGQEVKALAVATDGTLFAIANEYSSPPEPPRRSAVAAGRQPAGPTTGARPKPGKGTLYKLDPTGRPEKLMAHGEFHYDSLSLDERGRPHVGTGAEGRVYTVDDAHVVTLEADTDERQISSVSIVGGRGFVVASDPPVLHRVLGQGGGDAVWTSKALDAGIRARFGRVTWHGGGRLEISTRSGNTQAPDETWSPWSAAQTSAFTVASPAARFVQVRARFTDPRATLEDLNLPFLTQNLRPVVLDVSATPKSAPPKEPRSGLPATGGEAPKHDPKLKISWRVDNLDADPLRYRVSFRRDGTTTSFPLTQPSEVLTKTEYEWDTQALPEGRYRVAVEASDELANGPRDTLRHSNESSVVVVDNTPPQLSDLALVGRRLRARATDTVSNIARVEVAVDGDTIFRPLGAADGVFDSTSEGVDDDVSSLVPAGRHVVTVRAYDAAGNATSRALEAK
ncbi:MAG: hypothetical protein IPF92_09210 [Myxococcales bacterium]|nr:hypothetical protein [Myxococcales bacterium]HQY60012.1 hypothetical protein [Polyangiaceae bacterium]